MKWFVGFLFTGLLCAAGVAGNAMLYANQAGAEIGEQKARSMEHSRRVESAIAQLQTDVREVRALQLQILRNGRRGEK